MTDSAMTESTATEAVRRILGEVLGIDDADLTESFHHLGGDSLRALKAAGRIAFEFDTPAAVDGTILGALLDGTTGKELAQILLDSIRQEAAEEPGAPPPTELSFGEERLWMAQQYQRDRSTYHTVGGFRVTGTLDLAALDRAVQALVDRHPALRTRYAPDRPAVDRAGIPRPPIDVVHHREVVPWCAAEAAAERSVQQPFDLTSGRLLRVRTWRTGEREWLLLVLLHHIAIDGWSMDILYRELAALYAGDDPGPGETVDYRDFAQWLRSSAEVEAQAEAWAARLLPLPDRIELGSGRGRRPTRSLEGRILYTDLPPEIGDKLAGLAREARTSLFVVLLALLHVCLARRTGQWDALIGTVVAGRSRPQDHATIGYFTNTVPVRARATADATFGELVASLREEWRYVFTHQEVPLEELAVRTRRAPDPARTPLVDVVMVLQNNDDVPLMLADCVAEPLWMHTGTAKFDLLLEAIRVSGTLHLSWEYATEVLTPDEAVDLAAAFEQLARALPEDGGITLRELARPPLGKLALVDGVDAPRQPDVDLSDLFEAVVAARPDNVALYAPAGGATTLRELADLRDRVTGCLFGSGTSRGDVVAVDVDDPALSVAAVLAAWSVGAAVLVLDAGWSGTQRDQVMRACRPAVLIGGEAPAPGPVVITAGQVATAVPRMGASDRGGPDDPARAIPDLDASGTPAVVVGSHRGLLDRCAWAWDTFPHEPGELAVVHDLRSSVDALVETLVPLLAGVPVAVLPPTAASEARTTVEAVRRHRGTRLSVTPSLMWTILHSDPAASVALTTLRVCTFAGEELDADLLGRVREALPGCRLVNRYGRSTTAGFVTGAEVTASPLDADVPLGRPISSGTRVCVVDERGEPVPRGVVGELVVAGCHTGDLGRVDADGQLRFAGRGDREVRVRGFRVELAHVESTLRAMDGVAAAAAWTTHTHLGDDVLAAVVPRSGAQLLADDVRLALQYQLPSYMVPARVAVIDALPLTARGKLDRRALAASVATRRTGDPAAHGEVSAVERRIRAIWSQVLQGESPGPDDNFFALGGDSLAVTAMLTAVLREFGIELGLVHFLARPTMRGVVDQLVEHGAVA